MSQHEELEMAAELERIVRVAITAAAQIIERRARAQADASRQQVQQVREDALRQLRSPASGQDGASDPRATLEAWRTALQDGVNGDVAAAQRFAALTPVVERMTGLRIHELLADAVADAAALRDEREQGAQARRESDEALDEVLMTKVQVPPEFAAAEADLDAWHEAWTRREEIAVELTRAHTPEWFQQAVISPGGFDLREGLSVDVADELREYAGTGRMRPEAMHRVWAMSKENEAVEGSDKTVILPPSQDSSPELLEQFWHATATPERAQGWSRPPSAVVESLAKPQVSEAIRRKDEVTPRWEAAHAAQQDAARTFMERHAPEWFARGSVRDAGSLREPGLTVEAMQTLRATGTIPDEALHNAWAEYARAFPQMLPDGVETPSVYASPEENRAFWEKTKSAVPDMPASPDASTSESQVGSVRLEARNDRGAAPSKAKTPAEREHRQQAWADARAEFTANLPGTPTAEQARAAWDEAPQSEKFGLYWKHYDGVDATPSEQVAEAAKEPLPREQTRAPGEAAAEEPARTESQRRETGRTSAPSTSDADRGTAPSKAKTPAEREHRQQAWADARAEFTANLTGTPTAEQARAAWDGAPRGVKFGLYWKHYDGAGNRDRAASQPQDNGFAPSKAATPAERERREQAWKQARADHRAGLGDGVGAKEAEQAWKRLDWQDQALYYTTAYERVGAANETAQQEPVTRDRVVELNGIAADYLADRLPGSKGGEYMTTRLGDDLVASGDFRLGYAPAGWTNLTSHLRQAGASDEEIVAAGLGRESSRGSVIDAFRDRAMIGVRDSEGAVVGFVGRDLSGDERAPKYLNTGSTPAFTKGDHLLGAYEAREGAPVMRVEGPFDVLAVHAGSGGNVAAVAPMGTALTSTQADQLVAMSGDGRVWLGTDADAAGLSAAAEDFWALHERGSDVRMMQWPDGSDPAQLLERSPEALAAMLGAIEFSPSAAQTAMSKAIATHADDLRAGVAEAFEEIAALEDRARTHLDEPEAFGLGTFVSQQLEELRGEVDQARDEERVLDDRGRDVDAQADVARDAGDEQHAQRLGDDGQQLREGADDAHGREVEAGQDAQVVYDRALESNLDGLDAVNEAWSEEARRARVVSSYGYTRPTQEMLNETAQRATPARSQSDALAQGARRRRMTR